MVVELLKERAGLLELALRRAQAMSRGQQQRVGVARPLAQGPTVVPAGESVASLDPAIVVWVLSRLRDICPSSSASARRVFLPLLICAASIWRNWLAAALSSLDGRHRQTASPS